MEGCVQLIRSGFTLVLTQSIEWRCEFSVIQLTPKADLGTLKQLGIT